MGISSDIPATRKCVGFVGHGAHRGCSKRDKVFKREKWGDCCDYTGASPEDYLPSRDDQQHKMRGFEWLHAKNAAARKKLEREHGVRYSELYRLPYYSPVRQHTLDPLHNLFLRTAKNFINFWKNSKIISNQFKRKLTLVKYLQIWLDPAQKNRCWVKPFHR